MLGSASPTQRLLWQTTLWKIGNKEGPSRRGLLYLLPWEKSSWPFQVMMYIKIANKEDKPKQTSLITPSPPQNMGTQTNVLQLLIFMEIQIRENQLYHTAIVIWWSSPHPILSTVIGTLGLAFIFTSRVQTPWRNDLFIIGQCLFFCA